MRVVQLIQCALSIQFGLTLGCIISNIFAKVKSDLCIYNRLFSSVRRFHLHLFVIWQDYTKNTLQITMKVGGMMQC